MNKSLKIYEIKDMGCKCGCRQNKIDPKLVSLCNKIFKETGLYYPINSAFRCIDHNRLVGGSETSSHLKGKAVDLGVTDSTSRYKLLRAINNLGIKRYGVYKNFCHIDIDFTKDEFVTWVK